MVPGRVGDGFKTSPTKSDFVYRMCSGGNTTGVVVHPVRRATIDDEQIIPSPPCINSCVNSCINSCTNGCISHPIILLIELYTTTVVVCTPFVFNFCSGAGVASLRVSGETELPRGSLDCIDL